MDLRFTRYRRTILMTEAGPNDRLREVKTCPCGVTRMWH